MLPDSVGALRVPLRIDVFTERTRPTSPSTGAGPWSETMSGLSMPKSSANALAASFSLMVPLIFVQSEDSLIPCTFLLVDAAAATSLRPVQGHDPALRCTTDAPLRGARG